MQSHFKTYLPQCKRISLVDLPISADLYEHGGKAPCVLFIPGMGTYSEYYCEYFSKLSNQGFNVLSVDLRGHGYSAGPRGYYQLEEAVADLQLGLDYLSDRYHGRIGVVGCSLGSRLGLALAEADDRVQSLLCHTLFLSEVPPDIWHLIGWHNLAYTAFWMPYFKVDIRGYINIDALMDEFPLGRYALSDERMVWSYPASTLHSIYSSTSKVMQHDLGIPATVLIGENDQVIRNDYIRDLVSRTTQAFEHVVVAGEGHMLPLSNSDRMVEETREWFGRTL